MKNQQPNYSACLDSKLLHAKEQKIYAKVSWEGRLPKLSRPFKETAQGYYIWVRLSPPHMQYSSDCKKKMYSIKEELKCSIPDGDREYELIAYQLLAEATGLDTGRHHATKHLTKRRSVS